ncbi:hypothetical protein [Hafnia alvei]|uniref:Lipoprotein n=1 Tax=Hafnia alvei TaxID=569 RepID=A0A1C6Z193_HAFAL|nr:hypothetical protein [Hafnia alvei]NLS55055.1 hypothetical protein [Hafnia alvei]SCM52886.1 hypothetical protein BN1044_02373 [Hafnia alvei]
MPKKIIFSVALITTFLFGCDMHQKADASTVTSTSFSINVLPVIINAVVNEIPEIKSERRDAVLNGICRVAYGEIKPAALRDDINQAGLTQKISGSADALTKLIQSEDVKSYQTACAAYMITSIEAIPDVNQYVSQRKDKKGQPVIEVNEEAVINLMPFRLGVARATAELYGKLAADLPDKKPLSVDIYNQKIHRLFAQSAAAFLYAVRKYNQEEMNHHYQLLLLQKDKFKFKSSTGYLMDVGFEGVSLYLYGTPWLANGYIMGVTQSIDMTLK